MFGKKKKTAESNLMSEEVIKKFPYMVETLIVTTENEEIKKLLKELKSKVEYLNVSPKPEVAKMDKKIKNALEDLKILIVKNKKDQTESIKMAIKEITVLVIERESIYF